ncbi:MAG: hypothetical protein WC299_11590 [Kiritimatiellia bacterium]
MEETDVFGIRMPGTDTFGFVSVMGLLGEYHAVALYPGPKELAQFRQIQDAPDKQRTADAVLDICHFHAAFGGKKDMEASDKTIMKQLGLTFKGATAWPYFRSFRPGYYPWFVEADEARFLTLALEQLLDVAPRIKNNRSILFSKSSMDSLLVREPDGDEASSAWKDSYHSFPPPATSFQLSVPVDLINSVRGLRATEMTFEVDVFHMSARIGKKGERPMMPHCLLAVDSQSYFVLGVDMLVAEPSLEAIWAKAPRHLLEIIKKNGVRPKKIAVTTPWVYMVLGALCQELGIRLELSPELKALEDARRHLDQCMRR